MLWTIYRVTKPARFRRGKCIAPPVLSEFGRVQAPNGPRAIMNGRAKWKIDPNIRIGARLVSKRHLPKPLTVEQRADFAKASEMLAQMTGRA